MDGPSPGAPPVSTSLGLPSPPRGLSLECKPGRQPWQDGWKGGGWARRPHSPRPRLHTGLHTSHAWQVRVISGTAAPALPHSLLPHLYPEHPGRHTPGLPGLCRQLLPDAGKYPHCLPQSCRCRLGRDPDGTRKGLLAENTPGARGLLRPCKPSAHAPSGRASASLLSPHAESRLPWPAPHAFAHALAKAAPLPAPQTPAPSWVSSSLLVPEWSLACPPGCVPVHLGIPPRCRLLSTEPGGSSPSDLQLPEPCVRGWGDWPSPALKKLRGPSWSKGASAPQACPLVGHTSSAFLMAGALRGVG